MVGKGHCNHFLLDLKEKSRIVKNCCLGGGFRSIGKRASSQHDKPQEDGVSLEANLVRIPDLLIEKGLSSLLFMRIYSTLTLTSLLTCNESTTPAIFHFKTGWQTCATAVFESFIPNGLGVAPKAFCLQFKQKYLALGSFG